jgi:dTMP kinase
MGYFIVLEGLDGSGKSEVSRRVATHMAGTLGGAHVLATYEPEDFRAAGLYIRQVLAKKITISTHTLALAFALNRADHTEQVITPFLETGDAHVVVCDRYLLSSLVYQAVDGLTREDVLALNAGARTPDLTLFLDASADTCYQRMGARGSTRELFEVDLNATRARYLDHIAYLQARGARVVTVDANDELIDVINGVIAAINAHAPSWLRLDTVTSLPPTRAGIDLAPIDRVYDSHKVMW